MEHYEKSGDEEATQRAAQECEQEEAERLRRQIAGLPERNWDRLGRTQSGVKYNWITGQVEVVLPRELE